MPYIKPLDRDRVLVEFEAQNAGELNYLITKIVHEYVLNDPELKYNKINEVIGVLECAKLELYRMIASPYEDKKAIENGNISLLDSPEETK
jgi:hypothetical protein